MAYYYTCRAFLGLFDGAPMNLVKTDEQIECLLGCRVSLYHNGLIEQPVHVIMRDGISQSVSMSKLVYSTLIFVDNKLTLICLLT